MKKRKIKEAKIKSNKSVLSYSCGYIII